MSPGVYPKPQELKNSGKSLMLFVAFWLVTPVALGK